MIICMCRRLNEAKINEAVNAGASCPNSVMLHHGTKFNCGQCREEICEILSIRNEKQSIANSTAAE